MSTVEENLNFRSTLDDSQFQAAIGRMEVNVGSMTDQITNQNGELETFGKKAADLTNKIFSLENMAEFVKAIVKVRGEYQQLELSFSTILKSKSAADDLMGGLNSFAGKTPFSLKEFAAAAKQLLSYGSTSKDVVSELKTLGEVATGVAIPVADLAAIYGNLKKKEGAFGAGISQLASQGIPIYEELAKIMNVGKDEISGLVNSGRVGFPQVQQAFQNLTAAGGMFYGSMEAHSGTLGGQLETLRGAWDSMLNSLGQDGEGLFSGAIGAATNLVENYEKIIDVLNVLIVAYGAYRVAVALTSFVQLTAAEVSAGVTLGFKLQYYWVVLLDRANKFLNATMLANPYVLVAVAVGGLIAAMYLLHDTTSAYEKSQRQLNEGNAKAAQNADELKSKVSSLNNVLQDKNATDYQQNKSYEALQALYPRLFGNLSKEAYLRLGVVEAQKLINKENDRKSVEDLGKRYADAEKDVTSLKEELEVYNERVSEGGRGADEASKSVWSTKEALEVAVRIAAELGDEYRKHKDALDYANMSHKEKLEFLRQEKAELEAQRIFMEGFEKFYLPNDFFKNPTEAVDREKKVNELKTKALNTPKAKSPEDDENDKRKREQALKEREDRQNRYAEMMQKIYGVNEKYNDKFISDDQKKLNEIRKEFAGLQEEINQHNANPNNKKISTNLKPQLEKAIEGQKYENETGKLSVQLDRQKTLYDEYEEYKSKLGKDAADGRYKKEIDTNVTFLQKMEADRALLLARDPLKMTPEETDRLRMLDEKINLEVGAQQKKYDELVKGLISYEQERKALTEKYNAEFLTIEGAGKAEKQAILTKDYQRNLKMLDDAHIKEFESYKKLYEGIDKLSSKNALTVIANAKTMLVQQILTGKISNELANEIGTLIGNAEKSVSEKLPGNITNLAGQITQLASAVGGVDSAFGKVLGTLGGVLGQVGNIKKGMNEFGDASKKGDVFGQIGAGLGIVGAGFTIMSTLNNLFDRQTSADKAKADAKENELKQTEALTKALERQLEVANKAYGTKKIEEYKKAQEDAQRSIDENIKALSSRKLLTGDKDRDKIITKVNNGEKLSGWAWWGPSEKEEYRFMKKYLDGITTDVVELQFLIDRDKLDGKTAGIAQNYINATKAIVEADNAIAEFVTGTSFNSFADGIIDMFASGKTAAEDFADSFEGIIKKAIINSFKTTSLTQQLQLFYDEFSRFSKTDGKLTKEEIASLKDKYEKMMADRKLEFEELEKVTGIDFNNGKTDGSLKPSGLTASLTQDTGEKLEGLWRGQFDLTKQTNITAMQHLLIAKSNFDTGLKIEANTFRTANNTENLIRLVNIENTLISIDTKTSSKTTRD